jgi:hypothetical protein
MNFYVFIMKIITESERKLVSPPTPRADGLGPLVKRLECVLERLEELLDGRRTAEGRSVESPGHAEGAPDFIRRKARAKLLSVRSLR